jgi:hypothetical protein
MEAAQATVQVGPSRRISITGTECLSALNAKFEDVEAPSSIGSTSSQMSATLELTSLSQKARAGAYRHSARQLIQLGRERLVQLHG